VLKTKKLKSQHNIDKKLLGFLKSFGLKLLAYQHAIFSLLFFLILFFTALAHNLGWMFGLSILILVIWKITKGLAWHNVFFLSLILCSIAYLSLWSTWFFTSFAIILLGILFFLQMLKPYSESWATHFIRDTFFYILYLYFGLSLFTAFFILHAPFYLVFLIYIPLLIFITYLRLLQMKLSFSTIEFIIFVLAMSELFWLVNLMPLNYLNQALMLLIWYYLALETLKNRQNGDFFKNKIIYQFGIILMATILLSL